MDRGIFALWYDLPEDGEEEYLSWFHEVHLPELLSKREDYCWAAHYKNEGGGDRFHEVVKDMMRAGESDVRLTIARHDELGQLATGFNDLVARLQQHQQQFFCR